MTATAQNSILDPIEPKPTQSKQIHRVSNSFSSADDTLKPGGPIVSELVHSTCPEGEPKEKPEQEYADDGEWMDGQHQLSPASGLLPKTPFQPFRNFSLLTLGGPGRV